MYKELMRRKKITKGLHIVNSQGHSLVDILFHVKTLFFNRNIHDKYTVFATEHLPILVV